MDASVTNQWKGWEVPDGEISAKASDAKPDENSPLIINADRSTPMTLADQLAEYRLQHKQKFISQSTTAISAISFPPFIEIKTINKETTLYITISSISSELCGYY